MKVEAIYEDGTLHLLSPVPLKDGTKVRVRISTDSTEPLIEITKAEDEELLPPFTTMDVEGKGE